MAEKLDLRKQFKHLYAPSAKQVSLVDVPGLQFAMIGGTIQPGEGPETSPEFQEALVALYGISYTLKFISKLSKEHPLDYGVMALEGLWWTETGECDFSRDVPWQYTLMIMQPEHITPALFEEALSQLKKKRDSAALPRLRLERFWEGLCVQVMHIGPYADEPATIARMRAFAQENGYRFRGKHHEIYLGDPRRASPERLKTVLRHPVG